MVNTCPTTWSSLLYKNAPELMFNYMCAKQNQKPPPIRVYLVHFISLIVNWNNHIIFITEMCLICFSSCRKHLIYQFYCAKDTGRKIPKMSIL